MNTNLFSFLLFLTSVADSQENMAVQCDNYYYHGTLQGYTSLPSLLKDMRDDHGKKLSSYTYTICPDTIINMTDHPTMLLDVFPNNTLLKCGEKGSSTDKCMFFGGGMGTQIRFMGDDMRYVKFQGLTFSGMKETSGANVRAYASSNSFASFVDCHWEFNEGITVFDVMTHNQMGHERNMGYPAMSLSFHDCSFKHNNMRQSIIFAATGDVEISGSQFVSNNVGYFSVGAVFGSVLQLNSNTSFVDNLSNYFNVFIDSDSTLKRNDFTNGRNNKAALCPEGAFIEDKGSYCHTKNGVCNGTCCYFGDNSCDHESILLVESLDATQAGTSSNNEGRTRCGGKCITASLIGSFIFYVSVVVAFVSYRRYRRKQNVPQLSNPAQNEVS